MWRHLLQNLSKSRPLWSSERTDGWLRDLAFSCYVIGRWSISRCAPPVHSALVVQLLSAIVRSVVLSPQVARLTCVGPPLLRILVFLEMGNLSTVSPCWSTGWYSHCGVHERVLNNWPARIPKPHITKPTLILQPRALPVFRNPSQPCATLQSLRSLPIYDPVQEPLDLLLRCCVLPASRPVFCTPSLTLCYTLALPDKSLTPIRAFYKCLLSPQWPKTIVRIKRLQVISPFTRSRALDTLQIVRWIHL